MVSSIASRNAEGSSAGFECSSFPKSKFFGCQITNTKLIDELIGQINDVVGGLDAIMFNKYTRQPEKLRAWQSASHVERAPQREKKPTPAPTPTPPH